jgi:hypothetical protein
MAAIRHLATQRSVVSLRPSVGTSARARQLAVRHFAAREAPNHVDMIDMI